MGFALGNLFRASNPEDRLRLAERRTRELKGSIFLLLSLFELVAFTSYLPLDSYNLFQGRLDHMNNLGGIVGAALSEIFMGTVGVMGFAAVILTVWLSFCAFNGIKLKDNTFPILGTVITTILAAIAAHLLLEDKVPEYSLLQGGWLGRIAGVWMRHYFNTTGALLLVGGGFLFTLILTAGFSITHIVGSLLGSDDDEEEAAPEVAATVTKLIPKQPKTPNPPAVATASAPAAPAKPARRSRKPKNSPDAADSTIPNADGSTPDAVTDPGIAAGKSNFTFTEMIPYDGGYAPPSLRLLKPGGGGKKLSRGEARQIAMKLTESLLSFQITGEIVAVSQGPVLTTFEYRPNAGMKLSKIAGLADDLGIVMGTSELRIVAPIPGKTVVGIEIPRQSSEVISLKDVLGEDEFLSKKIRLPVALGKATDGTPVFGDLAAMPHLLVAGGTGSGKSVFINALITSFLFRLSPHQLRLILVDPKMLELNVFDGLPHLVTNVITDNTVAFNALSWAVMEMDRRYALMADSGSKNIDSYNEKKRNVSDRLPFIVIVVDELADLMMSGGQDVEIAITRLAQKARAAGIHLVLATQRPSTDVVTGLIKANMPSRLSFKVPSAVDSRTVLDTSGAEELIGRGDSLMIRPAVPLQRLHGAFVSEEELARVVKSVKGNKDYSNYYIDFGGKPNE